MRDVQPDISDLAYHLKQEKLFIESEKDHIKQLNEKVMKVIERVYHTSFRRGEQRRNYNDLVLRPHSSPPLCCQRANLLNQLQFIDGYQVLGHYEPLFGEMLLHLRENPVLCACCLVAGEFSSQDSMQRTASTIFSCIYANCILPEDEISVLSLLKNLMELQLAASENPRRLLHHGSCAFSQIYKTYVDALPQAKVFLTAALNQPIMQLLMEDELFLEVDPIKAVERFPTKEERLRRFGKEGTKEYEEALAKYRTWTINKLVNITKRFIESIEQAMNCFPATLAWLVRSVYEVLVKSKKIEMREINAICIDLVFTFFICSAVVTPEPQGIVDAPISSISRFNLQQVAQIIQVLAMNRWEASEQSLNDLYSHFDKDVMTSLANCIIRLEYCEHPPVAVSGNFPLVGLSRTSCIIPEVHLYALIKYLLKALESCSDESASAKQLESLLNRLKPQIQNSPPVQNTPKPQTVPQHNPQSSPKKNLLNRVKSSAGRKSLKHINQNGDSNNLDDSFNSDNGPVGSNSVTSQSSSSFEDKEDMGNTLEGTTLEYTNVLVIGLPTNTGRQEIPGMMSEERVMQAAQILKEGVAVKLDVSNGTVGKRTRFSLSHDEGSIGNTSDNLEAISEAPSNHSVPSSMDDVEQADPPDNLSDMVSANVSGRGTPNVSGRDTPSSQVTDGDSELRGSGGNEGQNHRCGGGGGAGGAGGNILVTVNKKPAHSDIEEKFGRFEIKPLLGGDETVSLVSDTWSTDVLASDSETIDAGDRENIPHEQFLDQHLEELDRMHGGPSEFLRGESAGETFETASEAWSTDVLASDSERLTEFDTDDAQSVARSDGTGRSEVEMELVVGDQLGDRGDANEENVTPRVHSSRSPINETEVSSTAVADDEDRAPIPSEEFDGGRVGTKFIPVMKISDEDSQPDPSRSFKPIQESSSEEMSKYPGDSARRLSNNEDSCTQSLGRLSLNLSDLPNNGIVESDQPLLLNKFMGGAEGGTMLPQKRTVIINNNKRPTILNSTTDSTNNQRSSKISSGGGSVEDSSIHLSTASLASSSSSGSEASSNKDPQLQSDVNNGPNTLQIISSSTPTVAAPMPPAAVACVAASGAIPKSISFDKTAEKGDKEPTTSDGDSKHKKGFFKGFKLPFKGRRKVGGTLSSRSDDYSVGRSSLGTDAGMRRSLSEDNRRPIMEESTDDILNKYRKKPEAALSETDSCPQISVSENSNSITESTIPEDERLIIDPTNVETSYAFKDAKRKLRLVLSTADIQMSSNFVDFSSPLKVDPNETDVITWLKTQIAEAQNLHERSLVAQLQETLRCIQLFDQQGREAVVLSLREDYQRRSPYIAYLVRSRQGLLHSIAHLEKLLSRLNADSNVIMSSMVSVCVRIFLEKRDGILNAFTENFAQLTVPDEKVDLVESFMVRLYAELARDPMWISSTAEQMSLAQMSLERAIMSHIYIHALYPNGDGDVSRDQVLFEHMKKLSAIITPDHDLLRIPKLHQYECPWPSAQAELSCLGAYKTSEDKVRCVVSAAKIIMNLLSMAHETTVPAADDFTPVLIFVLIKANPPGLLSTVQYIDLFYEQRLEGEDQYWWTQFKSAIEIIKNMDYNP